MKSVSFTVWPELWCIIESFMEESDRNHVSVAIVYPIETDVTMPVRMNISHDIWKYIS